LDFGLSRVRTKQSKGLGGTHRWAAPEVFSKRREAPGLAADVYSFGCVVYFAATNERPLEMWLRHEIETAKQNGDIFVFQRPKSLWLASCWPMVEQTTQHEMAQRPTMPDVHRQLMQWPEATFSSTNDGPATPAITRQRPFWDQVHDFRQRTCQNPQLVTQLRPRLLRPRLLRPRLLRQPQQPQQLQQHETTLQSGSNLHQPRTSSTQEGISAKAATDSGDLRFQEFVETPLQTMATSIDSAIASWNLRVPRAACCAHHFAITHLMPAVQRELEDTNCRYDQDRGTNNPYKVQCPECLAMGTDPEQFDSFQCLVCGFEGDSIRRSPSDVSGKSRWQWQGRTTVSG